MYIVPIDNLKEGMVLARDVASTSAIDYRTLLIKDTTLTLDMIALLRSKGIKQVYIVGDDPTTAEVNNLPMYHPMRAEYVQPQQDDEETNQHITAALTHLNEIFDENHEIKELSQEAVRRVDAIANDIFEDLRNDSSYLGNQMIALQNYDDYTYKHCLRVAMLSTSVCEQLGLDEADTKEVIVSALLHDIGKSNIDHDIIIKPGKLTDAEFAEIKRHPLIGYNILKNTGGYNNNIMSGVLFHQEKFDGTGYPTGISGRKIPLIARIIAVCDVFDALTSNRPYRKPWSVAEAEEYILGGSGAHFDYDIIAAFLRAFNPYPIGTMVSLSDGRHGVVIGHNNNVLRPLIKIKGANTNNAEEMDLANDFRYLSVMITGIYTGDYDA